MKAVLVLTLVAVVAASSVRAASVPDNNGDKIPTSAVVEAVKNAAEEEVDFFSVDGILIARDAEVRSPLTKCDNGKCRKKCMAQGKNGSCVLGRCVCFK